MFSGCESLDGVLKISNNLSIIPVYAFYNCSHLKGDLVIPDSVTQIHTVAFQNCSSLDGVLKLSSKLTKIDAQAFNNCSKLKGDVIIPDGVSTIGKLLFFKCSSLNSMKFLNKNTNILDSGNTIDSNIKIIGYSGSTAEEYATKYNRTFEKIEE